MWELAPQCGQGTIQLVAMQAMLFSSTMLLQELGRVPVSELLPRALWRKMSTAAAAADHQDRRKGSLTHRCSGQKPVILTKE